MRSCAPGGSPSRWGSTVAAAAEPPETISSRSRFAGRTGSITLRPMSAARVQVPGRQCEPPLVPALIGGLEETDGLQIEEPIVVGGAPAGLLQRVLGLAVRVPRIVEGGQLQPGGRVVGKPVRHVLQRTLEPRLGGVLSPQEIEQKEVAVAIVGVRPRDWRASDRRRPSRGPRRVGRAASSDPPSYRETGTPDRRPHGPCAPAPPNTHARARVRSSARGNSTGSTSTRATAGTGCHDSGTTCCRARRMRAATPVTRSAGNSRRASPSSAPPGIRFRSVASPAISSRSILARSGSSG